MEPNKKEQWIAETLASLDGIQRAEVPVDLAEKALRRLAGARPGERRVSPADWADARWNVLPRAAWAMAACAVFLLAINVFFCLQFGRSSHSAQNQRTAFTQEYFGLTPTLPL